MNKQTPIDTFNTPRPKLFTVADAMNYLTAAYDNLDYSAAEYVHDTIQDVLIPQVEKVAWLRICKVVMHAIEKTDCELNG